MEPNSPKSDASIVAQNEAHLEKSAGNRNGNEKKEPHYMSSQQSELGNNDREQLEVKNQTIIGNSSIIHADKTHSVEKQWIDDQMTENDEKIAELEKKVNSLHKKWKNDEAWEVE